MAREVEIPGGKAFFKEKHTGAGKKKLRAAALSAATNLSDYPELFEPGPPNETDEQRTERLAPALAGMRLTPLQAEVWDNMREATVIATLESWTLDGPIPSTIEALENLDGDLYDALLDAVGGVSAQQLETDFSAKPITPGDPASKETPTTGSSDSLSPSEDPALNLSTTTPGSDGSPTSGESSSPEQ